MKINYYVLGNVLKTIFYYLINLKKVTTAVQMKTNLLKKVVTAKNVLSVKNITKFGGIVQNALMKRLANLQTILYVRYAKIKH